MTPASNSTQKSRAAYKTRWDSVRKESNTIPRSIVGNIQTYLLWQLYRLAFRRPLMFDSCIPHLIYIAPCISHLYGDAMSCYWRAGITRNSRAVRHKMTLASAARTCFSLASSLALYFSCVSLRGP